MADDVVVTVPQADPPAAPVPVEEEEEEDLDVVAQMVAEESIVREEQHEQLMEVMSECQRMLTELSRLREQMGAENPMLTQILSQMAELQTQMDQIREMVSTKPPGSRNTEAEGDYPPHEHPSREDTGTTKSISESSPSPPEPPGPSEVNPPPKKRRFAKL